MTKIFTFTTLIVVLLYIGGFFNFNLFPVSIGLILLISIFIEKKMLLIDIQPYFLKGYIKAITFALIVSSILVFIMLELEIQKNKDFVYYMHLIITICFCSVHIIFLPFVIRYIGLIERYIKERELGKISSELEDILEFYNSDFKE